MSLSKRVFASSAVQSGMGFLAAQYFRFVRMTNKFVLEPADFYERAGGNVPAIIAMWHGQHFMMPFFRRPQFKVKVLISRHRDGEINAIVARHLGLETIRGSGDHERQYGRKGGVTAFVEMLDALANDFSVALTADVPKVARRAGPGIVKLAQFSGRPIFPVAVATSRRIELNTWDRSAFNLPFGRMAIVVGDPLRVPRDADETTLEFARQQVQGGLDAVTARAYAIVDRRDAAAAAHAVQPDQSR